MDSSSKQETNTDVPQNRLNEGCLLKLQSDNKKYAELLQELNAKLAAKEIELGGLKEMIKAREEKLWDLMDARDQLGLMSEDNEE